MHDSGMATRMLQFLLGQVDFGKTMLCAREEPA